MNQEVEISSMWKLKKLADAKSDVDYHQNHIIWIIWYDSKHIEWFSTENDGSFLNIDILLIFWNLKSPWATPHSGRSNRSSNRSGVSPSAERTRNQLSPSCGSIAPKRRKGSFWNSPRTRVSYISITCSLKKVDFVVNFL